jgi:transcriptional regulator with XRE-family HTH domain
MNKKPAAKTNPGEVLAKATARAGQYLGLSGAAIARVIGVSEPTVSRILRGDRPLDPSSKEGELALLLVRIYRSLDPLVGTDDQKRVAWMRSPNKALGGVPSQLIERADGLVAILNYLDGMRAPA